MALSFAATSREALLLVAVQDLLANFNALTKRYHPGLPDGLFSNQPLSFFTFWKPF
jgi:hypothetical protein